MGEGKAPGAAHSRISVSDQGPGVGIGESAEGISESLTLGRPPAQTNKHTLMATIMLLQSRYCRMLRAGSPIISIMAVGLQIE